MTTMNGFGGTGRIGHDSTRFYKRNMFKPITQDTDCIVNEIGEHRNSVLCQDSTALSDIPDSSVHLMITSPPYNVGKDYDKDLKMDEYCALLDGVFAETYRLLVNGGRACINIANVGRKPYIPFHSFIIDLMLKNGFLMRGEIIWDKGAGAGTSTAWGSWKSATNPTLRDVHEYILMFSKGSFKRERGENTITRDEFLEYTKSVWRFNPESAKKVGHPAPFPVELPHRCIQLYSFAGDVVYDPFAGSGTTGVAAKRSGRDYLLVDSNAEYCSIAERRIHTETVQTKLPI